MLLYYYPNRPTLIPPNKDYINKLEQSGEYIAEKKWNGDNVLIYTDTMEFWNRRKERHRFIPTPAMREELNKWPKHSVLNAELMNYRTKDIKNILIVHCIMAYKGKPLVGKTWGDSRKIIEQQQSGPCVQVSQVNQAGFWNLFESADGVTIEGVVIKRLAGKLIFSTTPIDDVSWMFKVRKPCKKYSF
jgi:hypothetical protein